MQQPAIACTVLPRPISSARRTRPSRAAHRQRNYSWNGRSRALMLGGSREMVRCRAAARRMKREGGIPAEAEDSRERAVLVRAPSAAAVAAGCRCTSGAAPCRAILTGPGGLHHRTRISGLRPFSHCDMTGAASASGGTASWNAASAALTSANIVL